MVERACNKNRPDCDISQAVLMAQMHMLDQAERNFGLTRKLLASATGIPTTTLKSYEEGTAMPLSAFIKLAAVKGFPNELLNLVLDLADKSVADAEPEEADMDDAARAAITFLSRYVDARHPEGPGGIRIVHNEIPDLELSAKGMADRAGKVAAA